MKRLFSALLALSMMMSGYCLVASAEHYSASQSRKWDIIDTAVKDGNFKTLTQALQASGLVNALRQAKEVTIFAPTDEAFAKLPPGILEDFMKPENKEKLISLLEYHVVEGTIKSKDIHKLHQAETLDEGKHLNISEKGGIRINAEAQLVEPDILAKNGVIHGIDTVLMPN